MLIFDEGHFGELKEAWAAGLPIILPAVGVSLLLALLAAIPPSSLPSSKLADRLAFRRRQLALAAASLWISAAIGLAIVFWAL